MSERVLTEVALQLLSRHPAACECFRCRSLRDLLDARRERDEAGPVLEAARILDRECQPSPIKAISIPGPLSLMRLFDALHKHDAARAAEGGGDE